MYTFAHRAALSACCVLASMAMTPCAQAQVTYDFSTATVANGPAGMIATNVAANTPTSSTLITMWINTYQQGRGCESTGCTDSITGGVQATADGSLSYDLQNKTFGTVQVGAPSSSFNRQAFIQGSGNGQGIYTQLVDPANTSFSFTFSGHSAAANQGVQITLNLNDPGTPSTSLFSQTVTGNSAGDWQLVISTPLGLDLLGKGISFNIGAASGTNTISSLVITPHLLTVPEPGTWSLMGLSLIGLTAMRRSRHHRHAC